MPAAIELRSDPSRADAGSLIRSFLRNKELRVVTREAGRPVIVTTVSLDGDVIAVIDRRWVRDCPLPLCAAAIAEHVAVGRVAFARLWLGIDRAVAALRVALALGGTVLAWSTHPLASALSLGAAILPRLFLYPVNVATRAYLGHLLTSVFTE